MLQVGCICKGALFIILIMLRCMLWSQYSEWWNLYYIFYSEVFLRKVAEDSTPGHYCLVNPVGSIFPL
jgi:hypothetical protein